jgi:flavodoxin
MKKVLIAYDSRTGKTQQMAEYIAEGVRISGNEAEVRKITETLMTACRHKG